METKLILQDVQYRTSKENYQVAIFNQLCEDVVKHRTNKTPFKQNIKGADVSFVFCEKSGIWKASREINFAGARIRKIHVFKSKN